MSKKFFISPPLKIADKIEVEITDLAYGGDSVAKYNDFIIFVPYGVPGSKVLIEITEIKRDFARGKILKNLKLSEKYTEPICNAFGKCGGCDWMNISYNEQIEFKIKILNHALLNIAKLKYFKIEKFITYEKPFYYRNRVQYKLTKEGQKINFGFFKAKSHEIVPIEKCYILNEEINKISEKIKKILNDFAAEIDIYDEKQNRGYLRHICLRVNNEGKVLLTFVVAKKETKDFINKTVEILKKEKNISGVTVNFNLEKGNKIFGEKEKVIWGHSYIIEKVRNINFKLDSTSFFQINSFMLENIINFIENNTTQGEKILDLYGGVGALTLPLHNRFKEIIVVEIEKKTIQKLKETIELNNLKNVKFIHAKAEEALEKVIKDERINQVVVDPPRKGLHPKIISVLRKSNLDKLIYISCNPISFSRDLFLLKEKYSLKKIIPLDQFSHTYHFELMAFFHKE